MGKINKKIFFYPKWMEIIYVLATDTDKDKTVTTIMKTLDCTYAVVCNIIRDLEYIGLVDSRKFQNKKILTLTSKGNELGTNITDFKNNLDRHLKYV